MALAEGDNVIKVKVTAADGNTTQTYTVTVTRAAATDTTAPTLTSASVARSGSSTTLWFSEDLDLPSGTTLSATAQGAFSLTTDSGQQVIREILRGFGAMGARSLIVHHSKIYSGETVVVRYDQSAAGADAIADAAGNEVVDFTTGSGGVPAVTNSSTQVAPSTDATLSALTVTGGGSNLVTFVSGTTTYTARVASTVTEVTLTPTKNNTGATIEYLDGDDATLDDAGTAAGHQVAVAEGANVIKVKVTAADGNTTQTYTVTVTRAAPDTPSPYDPNAGITMIDTNGDPLTGNPIRLTIREGTRGRYGFKLNTRPTSAVWVAGIQSDGDPDVLVLPSAEGAKAILADEWETPFYVKIRAALDDDEENGERYFLNCVHSRDRNYNGLILPDVIVVEDDRNDDAGALSVADAEATEGVDDTLDFVVKLDRRPSLGLGWEVTVDYRTQDGRATAGSDYTSTSGTLTFAPGEDKKTVSVPIMDDAVEDDGETFTLVLSNAFNAGFARNGTQAVGTIRNTEPLTATFPESVYASAQHTGPSDRPQVVVAFSAPVAAFGADTPSVSATGASVDGVQRLDKEGLEHAYVFFLTPEGHQAIVFRLHANRACPDGGICTADRRRLSNSPSATVAGPETGPPPLTAAFEGLPESHDGEDAFRVRVAFSEEIGIGFRSMRDESFTVDGGEVTGARRVDGRHDLWEITVEPDSDEAMTITLPAGRACAVSGAICTRGGNRRQLTNTPTATVAGPPVVPLTADFVQKPYEHDGETAFKLRIAFSEGIAIGFRTFRDQSVSVSGGGVTKAKRVDRRKDLWEITVEPDTNEAVTLTLAGGRACGTAGAVCTGDGRALSAGISTTVLGPAALTVADARVDEAADAVLDFAVTLSRATSGTVAVAYATADGSATAGSDYTATAGTLTFAPGETAKTVTVPVLDDAHDEGEETLTLRLSAATGAVIADGEATGTIKNTDHLQRAWLARFGRTAATHVTDAVGERLRDGSGASHVTVGGYRLPLEKRGATDGADDGVSGVERLVLALGQRLGLGTGTAPAGAGGVAGAGGWPDAPVATDPRLGQSRTLDVGNAVNLRQVLLGSSFRLAWGRDAAGASSPRLTAWGRVAGTTFDGRDGKVSLDGDVLTGTVGVDGEWDRLLAGLAVAHSRGDGSYTMAGTGGRGRGDLENTLTSIHPYLRYAVNDRLDVWGLCWATGGAT